MINSNEKENITIVGAGMAGLLAANILAPNYRVRVVETQKTLPNNHSAVLRFRTDEVGKVLGIPFKKVQMIKATLPWRNPVADSLAYSFKNTGIARSDRSVNAGTVVGDRYIAPPNFIEQLERRFLHYPGTSIAYGHYWQPQKNGHVISTLPMPVLMDLLKWPKPEPFQYSSGINVRCRITGAEAYASLIVPSPEYSFSRVSITGDEMIVEVPRFELKSFETTEGQKFLLDIGHSIAERAAVLLGFSRTQIEETRVHKQAYAKILPVSDRTRHDFIYSATHDHGIFALGRFATWRPHLLLDDLLKDIGMIDGWMSSKSRYQLAKAGSK